MTEVRPPTTADIQKSLQRLRSSDPAERLRGVEGLSGVTDDPLVMQLFDHLYRTDPDEKVRDAVWRVINRQGPSVPAPASDAVRHKRVRRTQTHTYFLNPANRPVVARTLRESIVPVRRGHRLLDMLFVLALIAAAFLWGLAAEAWYDWFRLREDGVRAEAAITGLSAPTESNTDAPYTVAYRFRLGDDDDAPEYFGEQRITPDLYAWMADAGTLTLPVIYLPADPSVSRLDLASPDDTQREQRAILAGGVTVIALLLGVVAWIVRLPNRGLLRGKLLRGQVVAAQGKPDAKGNQRVTVRFRFRTPNGRVITSEATRTRNESPSIPVPLPGAPVLIEYHSDRRFRLL